MSIRELDLATWKRRDHYQFFRGYEDPYFGICAELDVTALAARCAEAGGPSFFLATLHRSLAAANAIEDLRYRIRGERVVVHDRIHGGCTVLRPDETFVFAYFDFDPDFAAFAASGELVLAAARSGPGGLPPRPERDDVIHHSVLPWVSFTAISHPRRVRPGEAGDQSVPRIVFGKRRGAPGALRMPVAIEAHHALVDGLHLSKFLQRFQELLDEA